MFVRISTIVFILLFSYVFNIYCQKGPIKVEEGGYTNCIVNEYTSRIKGQFKDKPKFKMYEYKYDNKGNIIELLKFFHDIIQNKQVTKYDDKGNIIEIIIYDVNGDIEKRETNRYNANGKLIEKNYYIINDSLYSQEINIYDDKDNLIEFYVITKGNISHRHKYKYDDFGNVIEDVYFDNSNEPLAITKYIYSN